MSASYASVWACAPLRATSVASHWGDHAHSRWPGYASGRLLLRSKGPKQLCAETTAGAAERSSPRTPRAASFTPEAGAASSWPLSPAISKARARRPASSLIDDRADAELAGADRRSVPPAGPAHEPARHRGDLRLDSGSRSRAGGPASLCDQTRDGKPSRAGPPCWAISSGAAALRA